MLAGGDGGRQFGAFGNFLLDFIFVMFSHALLIHTTYIMQSEDDFYVRYYTLQLLTALITNSPKR
jgi:hypothetical protein